MNLDLRVSEVSFEVLHEIGQTEGLNSKTYVARDVQLNAQIVIKEIPKSEIQEKEKYFSEARHLYAFKHPNVMEIHYASQTDNLLYLAMPYYKNGSLNALIEHRFLSVREIIKYSLDFLSALHYIHSKGLIHFDVKPSNIIIDDSGKAILTDFGLAELMDYWGFAQTNMVYPTHLVPELFEASAFSPQYDIYQAGLTIYRMCNGNNEFNNKRLSGLTIEEVIAGNFPNRSKFLPHIPLSLRKLIQKALMVRLEDRYETIIHLMNDIAEIKDNLNWCYELDSSTHSQNWIEIIPNGKKTLKLYQQPNGNWKTEGEKFTTSSGNTSRISAWNRTHASLETAYAFIETEIQKK